MFLQVIEHLFSVSLELRKTSDACYFIIQEHGIGEDTHIFQCKYILQSFRKLLTTRFVMRIPQYSEYIVDIVSIFGQFIRQSSFHITKVC